jgi:hypothetical protein
VADPWSNDLAALGTHSRTGLRSLAMTRAACTDERKPKMRFFKQHPALATLLVLAILALFAPVAYAIVDRVFLSIDVSKSETEIENDIYDQLHAAGHPNAVVTAKKSDHQYEIAIESQDPALGKLDLEIAAGGKTYKVHFEIPPTLPESQQMAVGEAVSKALQRPAGKSDAEVEKTIVDDLTQHGVREFTVRVRDTSVSVVIQPPR